jgi:hypothetical protein
MKKIARQTVTDTDTAKIDPFLPEDGVASSKLSPR